jgi:hypothetical protein
LRLLKVLAFALAMIAASLGLAPRALAAPLLSSTATSAASNGTAGWDSYSDLDQLPYLPTGVTAYEQSSFDRNQGNRDYSNVLAHPPNSSTYVLAQHQGPGEIDKIWTTARPLSATMTLTIQLDGKTVLSAPAAALFNGTADIVNGGPGPFTYPLVMNASQSSGGYDIDVPMPFTESMEVIASENPGYYHVEFRSFPSPTGITTFNPASAAPSGVLPALQEAGSTDPKPTVPGAVTQHGTFQVMPGQSATVAAASGSGQVTGLRLQIPHLTHPTTTPLTDNGRAFGNGGSSSFTVPLDKDNTGIQVTRRYDPEIGEQKANLLVDGAQAGVWGPEAAVAAGSWADETVSVPASFTAGKSSVTLTNAFVSSAQDFNEFTYTITQQVGGVWVAADTFNVGPGSVNTTPSSLDCGKTPTADCTATEIAHKYTITGETWAGVRDFSYPLPGPITDTGRGFGPGGGSTFTMAIDPGNTGIELTRRLDPEIGAQVASVTVDGAPVGNWAANPKQAAGNWADESIEIPASLTQNKSSITVKTSFVSSGQDFNEFTYWAYSHVAGGLELSDTLDVGNTTSEPAHGYAITGQDWSGSRDFSYPDSDQALTSGYIKISFDGRQTVYAPLGQFFGSALGEWDTRSLMTSIDTRPGGWLSSWWPMPYGSSVSVSLVNGSGLPLAGQIALTTASDAAAGTTWGPDLASGAAGYFHAYSHSGATVAGQDWNFLQATGHGKVVGVVLGMTGPTTRTYLEGNERAYTDGSASPQINGTGTEDYFGGGWYFNQGPFTDPFNGNTSHEAGTSTAATGDCPAGAACTGAYRLLIDDSVPYSSSIKYGIQHGPEDNVSATYASTAFYYGQDTTAARQTDSLTVGDPNSEQAHGYTSSSPGSLAPLAGASYEGNDGTQIALTRPTRATTAAVTFTMAIDPGNQGVELQRTSDQDTGFQAAEVSVNGTDVGEWLEPLANTYHRWLDDQFTIPASATAGQHSITVTLTPVSGAPAWSAASYRALSLGVSPPVFERRSDGSVWYSTAASCGGPACTGWTEIDSGQQLKQIAVSGSAVYELRTNGSIWTLPDWELSNFPSCSSSGSCPAWMALDENPAATAITVSSGNLFELHSGGSIWESTGVACSGTSCPGWKQLDTNPKASAIVAGAGTLFELHSDGSIWQSPGQNCASNASDAACPGWAQLDDNAATTSITAGRNALFELHSDGAIWESTGQACSDSTSGASCPGWYKLDQNAATTSITAGAETVFQLHSDGTVWQSTGQPCASSTSASSGCPGWTRLDDNPSVRSIVAGTGTLVYELRSDGSVWQSPKQGCSGSGCPGWSELDNTAATAQVAVSNDS